MINKLQYSIELQPCHIISQNLLSIKYRHKPLRWVETGSKWYCSRWIFSMTGDANRFGFSWTLMSNGSSQPGSTWKKTNHVGVFKFFTIPIPLPKCLISQNQWRQTFLQESPHLQKKKLEIGRDTILAW